MNKLIAIAFLALTSFGAAAQTVTKYPEYQRVYEDSQQCYDVVTQRDYNPAGVIIGGVVGYAIGREIDRSGRGGYGYGYSHPHRGYAPGRGHYYRTQPHYYPRYESRAGRYGGAVVGGYVGSQIGRGERVERVCEQNRYPSYREVLIGYRVIYRYPDGTTREQFERVR